ncbi:hypothetical protein, partial [Mesorhizobium sp. LSHC420B00]|uniref:hypothetical protein n=1 Tax=Mesorhizobium sp. LSHC420B00 TaxID=1287292 RepID=UPI001AEC0E0D
MMIRASPRVPVSGESPGKMEACDHAVGAANIFAFQDLFLGNVLVSTETKETKDKSIDLGPSSLTSIGERGNARIHSAGISRAHDTAASED